MPRLTLSLSALVLAVFGGSAAAQVVPAAGTAPTSDAGLAYRARQVLGTTVNIQGNRGIGTVDDIVFDPNGQVDYLIVANQGRLVTVPWQAARYDPTARTAVVNITPEQFQTVPTFTVERYPNFYAPTYRTDIYRYYGLTPGQERRLDRQERREERRVP